MKKFSLSKRLIGAVILSQLLLAAGLVLVAIYHSHYYLQGAFDVNLEGRAMSVAALVYYPDDGSPGLLFNAAKIPPSSHRQHPDLFLVKSDHGNFERHSASMDPKLFDPISPDARFWNFQWHGEPYRAIVLRGIPILDTEEGIPLPLPKLTVIYAAPTTDIVQRLWGLAGWIALACALLVIPTLVLAVWTVRRTLAPLNDLAAEAGRISVRNWEFRPPPNAKAALELEPLTVAIDTVLNGLHQAFTTQRQFLGDAAHELKTSLAILKSTLQTLLNRTRTVDDYRHGLLQMSEDSDRLEELLDRMLRLARVEQWAADGIHRELDRVDLASTCEMAVARMARLSQARDVQVRFVNEVGMAEMLADPADLELVWLNLLENAIHYSPTRSTVAIHLEIQEKHAVISVIDHGCGIPETELPYVFERFRRGDPSRARATGGYGLGLAIAKSIVEAYRGSIHLESTVGVGTRISVDLPLSPQASKIPNGINATQKDRRTPTPESEEADLSEELSGD